MRRGLSLPIVLGTACAGPFSLGDDPDTASALPFVCPSAVGRSVGPQVGEPVVEASGLAARGWEQGWWAHNDSGSDARVLGINDRGEVVQQVVLDGVRARDFEDMARSFTALGADVLWLADIGDNGSSHADVVIHRALVPVGPGTSTVDVTSFRFTYEDGQGHDAEALMWDAEGDALVVITKTVNAVAQIYRAQPDDGVLAHVGDIDFGADGLGVGISVVTGADASEDGRWVVVRSYAGAWIWPREPGTTLEEALAGPGCNVRAESEPQGEAIAFGPNGFATLSEGRDQPLWLYDWPPTSP